MQPCSTECACAHHSPIAALHATDYLLATLLCCAVTACFAHLGWLRVLCYPPTHRKPTVSFPLPVFLCVAPVVLCGPCGSCGALLQDLPLQGWVDEPIDVTCAASARQPLGSQTRFSWPLSPQTKPDRSLALQPLAWNTLASPRTAVVCPPQLAMHWVAQRY